MTEINIKHKKRRRKETKIEVRVTEEFKNNLKKKALLYCKGNVSEYIINALENYWPSKDDLEIKKP